MMPDWKQAWGVLSGQPDRPRGAEGASISCHIMEPRTQDPAVSWKSRASPGGDRQNTYREVQGLEAGQRCPLHTYDLSGVPLLLGVEGHTVGLTPTGAATGERSLPAPQSQWGSTPLTVQPPRKSRGHSNWASVLPSQYRFISPGLCSKQRREVFQQGN